MKRKIEIKKQSFDSIGDQGGPAPQLCPGAPIVWQKSMLVHCIHFHCIHFQISSTFEEEESSQKWRYLFWQLSIERNYYLSMRLVLRFLS